MAAIWSILREFFQPPMKQDVIPPDPSFRGQSVLVTGATGGMGLETAIHYVNLGANPVHITARNAARGAEAQKVIEERTGRKGIVRVWVLDMDTFDGVQDFMNIWKKNVNELDILLLNAGTHHFAYQESPDGWEMDLQVNALGTTLLGLLMLQWLRSVKKQDQTQHLGFVGSGAHFDTVDISSPKFPQNDALKFCNQKENYPGGRPQYGISKLFQQYAFLEITKLALAKDGRPSPIINSVCPGFVKTDIARGFSIQLLIQFFFWMKAVPVDVGANSLVLLGTTTPEQHGKFFRPYYTDEEYAGVSATNITSEQGRKMRAAAWKDIIGILSKVDKNVAGIAGLAS